MFWVEKAETTCTEKAAVLDVKYKTSLKDSYISFLFLRINTSPEILNHDVFAGQLPCWSFYPSPSGGDLAPSLGGRAENFFRRT